MANYPKCPNCGAIGTIAPNCFCTEQDMLRGAVWNWYVRRSQVEHGALATHFAAMAEKVKQGHGDSRLHDILSGQQDYDLGARFPFEREAHNA